MTNASCFLLEFGNVFSILKFAVLSSIVAQAMKSPPHEPCVLQASMFINQERPFYVPIYA
jgi:hypothetical protein